MKKINILCLILALVMVIGLFAGCGAEKPADTTAAPVADDEGTPLLSLTTRTTRRAPFMVLPGLGAAPLTRLTPLP